ncbi:DUF6538 domain-containing protein [Rhizobium sp. ZK1]
MSTYLRREADSFVFRRRVPAPLQALLGQTEIYRSLERDDFKSVHIRLP